MKNFRKVLALILVVATLFSFVAMTSAREVGDYTDYDKVSYQEAVDVLTAVGVLDGYTDGSFKPASTITRAEMAKMIAVLSNAGTDIKNLYAGSCKFADSKNNWAASYIAYCANTGIVAGRNATTFDPNGKVTGLETAKMLLCVLGFDASYQKYVGTNWMTYVMADAKNYGLLAGFAADYDITVAITREEAAQMMLNALKANLVVGTLSESIIKLSNSLYVELFEEEYEVKVGNIAFTVSDAQKYGWIVLDGNVVISPVPLYSIYEGLKRSEGYDCYGNPSIVWTYTNSKGTTSEIGTYVLGADYSATTEVDFEDVLSEEINGSKKYYLEVYEDGNAVDVKGTTLKTADLDYAKVCTGKGVETHIYVDDRYDYETISGKETLVGRVVITIKNTYIDQVASTAYAINTFTLSNGARYSNAKYGFEKGDMVLYWVCKDGLHDAEVVAPVVTNVKTAKFDERYDGAIAYKTSYVVSSEGKKYEYAETLFETLANNKSVITDPTGNNTNTYDLYLDKYGYVMAWNETVDTVKTGVGVYVRNSLKSSGTGHYENGQWVNTYTAEIVSFETGKTETVTLNDNLAGKDDIVALMAIDNKTARDGYDALVSYKLVGEKVDIAHVDGLISTKDYDGDDVADGTSAYGQYAGNGTTNTYYLSSTGSIVRYENNDPKPQTWMDGDSSTKYMVKVGDTYTVYTAKELAEDYYPARGSEYGMQFFYTETASGHKVLAYVFIEAKFTLTDARAYVVGYEISTNDSDWETVVNAGAGYRGYSAIINGQPAILAVSTEVDNGLNLYQKFTMVQANLQYAGISDGEEKLPIYTAVELEDVNVLWYQNLEMSADGSHIYLKDASSVMGSGSYPIADDCIFVVAKNDYDPVTGSFSTYSAEVVERSELQSIIGDFVKNEDGTYKLGEGWYYTKNGEVTEIYLNVVVYDAR